MLTVIRTKINYKEIYNLVKNLPTGKNVLTKPRGDFFYDPHILDEQYKGTEIEKVLDLIPMHGEARVIVMEPGQSYSAHADVDDRWHLTLDADESYLVDLKNEKMYKSIADGTLYLMDSGRLHTASNYGYKPRYQLVIRKRLKGRILDNPVYFNLTLIDPPYNARYLFDKSFWNIYQYIIDNIEYYDFYCEVIARCDICLKFDIFRTNKYIVLYQMAV